MSNNKRLYSDNLEDFKDTEASLYIWHIVKRFEDEKELINNVKHYRLGKPETQLLLKDFPGDGCEKNFETTNITLEEQILRRNSVFIRLKRNWRNKMYKPAEKEIFHIHTYRCKHASDEDDEAYVKAAVDLGAKRIVFTDHAPFPGNPFGHRMQYEELSEYISSLLILKDKYAAIIEIIVGLEIEYFPSFEEYYRELKENSDIEVLMLGQHMFEVSSGCYSFQCKDLWFPEIAESVIQGIRTDIFDGVAHPDRVFKKETIWTDEMQHLSEIMVWEAGKRAMFLEKNKASKKKPYHYWPQFWEVAERMRNNFSSELLIINGLDAHSTKEIISEV